MGPIPLTPYDLGLAALLVLLLSATSYYARLAISRPLLLGGLRTAVQLVLIGVVLEALFASSRLRWVVLMALVMLLFAGREVLARQQRRFTGWWGYGLGTVAMFVSSASRRARGSSAPSSKDGSCSVSAGVRRSVRCGGKRCAAA
jgi:UDP-glucose/iron transport system permease protein